MKTSKKPKKSTEFLASLNYFRGIAILIIVAGHCFKLIDWQPNGLLGEALFNLFVGGTALFVFISGFLFHHIYHENFKYKKFLRSKLNNVITPYLFMSIIPISLAIFRKGGSSEFKSFFFTEGNGVWIDYIRPTFLYILTGKAILAYWYIPFAMIIFLLSPIFIPYINSNSICRGLILFSSLLIPITIHRPVGNFLVLQSVFYFSPVYLLGIQSSIHRNFIYRHLKNKEILLLTMAVVLAIFQSTYLNTVGNFQKPAFILTIPDVMIIQKCLLCLFFMVLLHRFEAVNIPVLNKTASASFAIFFLHALIIEGLRMGFKYFNISLPGLWAWFILVLLVTFFCYCIANVVKKRIPRSSRMLIGW